MKTRLTAEQSDNLISKGVSVDKASEIEEYNDAVSKWTHRGQPVFTLSDLLEILPKTIYHQNYYLDLSCGGINWTASYIHWDYCDHGTYIRHTQGEKTANELIDALYSLVLWCIDNNYLKYGNYQERQY